MAASQNSAIGVRAHSGWAVVVAVRGNIRGVEMVDRRVVELADPGISGSKQPYHTAELLGLTDAERLIALCRAATWKLARGTLTHLLQDLMERKCRPVGCCVLSSSGRAPGALADILRSHSKLHAAEGDFFRSAIADASAESKLPVVKSREKEVAAALAKGRRVSPERLQKELAVMGKALGPPWREDQKLATMAAWLVLAQR